MVDLGLPGEVSGVRSIQVGRCAFRLGWGRTSGGFECTDHLNHRLLPQPGCSCHFLIVLESSALCCPCETLGGSHSLCVSMAGIPPCYSPPLRGVAGQWEPLPSRSPCPGKSLSFPENATHARDSEGLRLEEASYFSSMSYSASP